MRCSRLPRWPAISALSSGSRLPSAPLPWRSFSSGRASQNVCPPVSSALFWPRCCRTLPAGSCLQWVPNSAATTRAALSAVLLVVALRMAEWHTFVELWRGPRTDFGVLVTAFGLTVIFDLTIGVGAGLIMAVVLFLRQMEEVTHVRLVTQESEVE